MVVFGQDKLDEISMSAPTSVCEIKDGWFQSMRSRRSSLDMRDAVKMIWQAAHRQRMQRSQKPSDRNEKGPKRQAVCMNAGAALYIAGKAKTIEDGVKMAENLIDSGAAAAKLAEFIKLSNEI